MQTLISLIDKASELCGGDSALARRIGVSKQLISMIRKGERPATPEVAGLLAEAAGEPIAPACMAAMLDSFSRTERGQRLRAEMEKRYLQALASGAEATLGISATPSGRGVITPKRQHPVDKIYIVSTRAILKACYSAFKLVPASRWVAHLVSHRFTPGAFLLRLG